MEKGKICSLSGSGSNDISIFVIDDELAWEADHDAIVRKLSCL